MNHINRREFIAGGGASLFAASAGNFVGGGRVASDGIFGNEVQLRGDGLSLSPKEYSRLIASLIEEAKVEPDYYSNGGAVAEMETLFATLLGKERAVFFPTGTLANHVAIRELAGEEMRVIVQERSHIYNDSGDCLQVLSNLNLIPLARDEATFTVDEVKSALRKTEVGRVKTNVGVIAIESPVRRKLGEVFDFEEMKRVSKLAKEQGIRLHLDGARIFIASAYSGIPVSDYAALFDTVYVSLYKYFNAPFGAVLAGPADMLDGLYHVRRMFGGGLPQVWFCAIIASHFLDGFIGRFKQAIDRFEVFLNEITRDGSFNIERIPNGTNICMLRWDKKMKPEAFRKKLMKKGIILYEPATYFEGFLLTANETINRIDPIKLASIFKEAVE